MEEQKTQLVPAGTVVRILRGPVGYEKRVPAGCLGMVADGGPFSRRLSVRISLNKGVSKMFGVEEHLAQSLWYEADSFEILGTAEELGFTEEDFGGD